MSFLVGDMYHDFEPIGALASNVVAADISTDTTTIGAIVDCLGYEEVAAICWTETLTDGDYEFELYGGNESDMSDEVEITGSDASIVGLAAEPIPDWEDHATEADTIQHFSFKVIYRYYRIKIKSTDTSSGGRVGCIFFRGRGHHVSVS